MSKKTNTTARTRGRKNVAGTIAAEGGVKADALVLYGDATQDRKRMEAAQHRATATEIEDDLRDNAQLRRPRVGRPGVGDTARALFNQRRSEGVPLPLGRSGQREESRAIRKRWPKNKPPKKPPEIATISSHISQAYKDELAKIEDGYIPAMNYKFKSAG